MYKLSLAPITPDGYPMEHPYHVDNSLCAGVIHEPGIGHAKDACHTYIVEGIQPAGKQTRSNVHLCKESC